MKRPTRVLAASSILASVSSVASLLLVNDSAFLMLFTLSIITLYGALTLERN
jgi:hypothetical protein